MKCHRIQPIPTCAAGEAQISVQLLAPVSVPVWTWILAQAWILLLALTLALMSGLISSAGADCLGCHDTQLLADGVLPGSDPHAQLAEPCTSCHRGDARAEQEETAHLGLIAAPGELSNAQQACGSCHTEEVIFVLSGLMHTGKGMVNVTRFTFGESEAPDVGQGDLSCCARLGDSPADSLLRKRCASCHLGQPRHQLGTDHPIGRRGGGCLACHLSASPTGQHPTLTRRVSDESCVGCHSRSGRIALSYAGLAEVDADALHGQDHGRFGYLPDGRLVEQLPADLHHRAGLSCIDCHTKRDVMGPTSGFAHASAAVDIQCQDCHGNTEPRIRLAQWPHDLAGLRTAIPYPVSERTEFLVTARRGTPLWHIEVRADGLVLHRKSDGGRLLIPPMSARHHPAGGDHQRLTCTACHSGWVPQCYGCHMQYDPEQEQWDHVQQAMTPGAWLDARWGIRNQQPVLGVNTEQRIAPFVPGMIRSVEHPDLMGPPFRRLFAPLAPHTTLRGLDCAACHRNPVALGLGQGRLLRERGSWTFLPAQPASVDGLPEDAFVTLSGRSGTTTRRDARGFTPDELIRILDAPLVD